ncbi:hypothetical protein Sjap_007631 [Stephania japonica]|uniref:F-box domain-containing protein n=1 Tax=Stephania japonica TaxID=461633 RepID=A0AAP0JN30_9MAGN
MSSYSSHQSQVPDEILTAEILPRLPAKSLLRFKSVCKAWRSWISDPNFVDTHLLNHQPQSISGRGNSFISFNKQLSILFVCSRQLYTTTIIKSSSAVATARKVYYDPQCPNRRYPRLYPRVWGSCNGLICLETEEFFPSLWNPCTQLYKRLPYCGVFLRYGHGATFGWFLSSVTYGFGYDAKNKDYKLVRIGRFNPLSNFVDRQQVGEVTVLTLRSNSWKMISNTDYLVVPRPGKFFDGGLYWAMDECQPDKLIRFDIHEEEFSEIRLPNVFHAETTNNCTIDIVAHLGGCLGLWRTTDVYHEVWVLKENWMKMYTIDVLTHSWARSISLIGSIGDVIGTFEEKNSKNNGVEIVYVNVENGGLISYCPNTDEFRSFSDCDEGKPISESVITYVESLATILANGTLVVRFLDRLFCFWGACNGLFYLELCGSRLALWNPCIGSYRELPCCGLGGRLVTCIGFGFGYDAKIKDFKLVKIGKPTGNNCNNVHVFTVGANSWRRISDANYSFREEAAKFINEFLYWSLHKDYPYKLIRFDIHNEVFSELRGWTHFSVHDVLKPMCESVITYVESPVSLDR